jgi:hypothetical protein
MRAVRSFTLEYQSCTAFRGAKKEERFIMEITVRITSVYGARTVYPVCETAKIFADIAGTKTLKPTTINAIKSLGYKIIVAQEEL